MKKHQFRQKTIYHQASEKIKKQFYQCCYCHEKSGLNIWQLMSMPKSMAVCSKSKDKPSILESLIGNYDCVFI